MLTTRTMAEKKIERESERAVAMKRESFLARFAQIDMQWVKGVYILAQCVFVCYQQKRFHA